MGGGSGIKMWNQYGNNWSVNVDPNVVAPSTNQWHHFASARDNTGTLWAWIDGSPSNPTTHVENDRAGVHHDQPVSEPDRVLHLVGDHQGGP